MSGSGFAILPPPSVSLSISIDPLIYSVSSAELPNFSVSITSHAPRPITVFTAGTVLTHLRPFDGDKYCIIDLTANQRVWNEDDNVQRPAYRRQLGSRDEEHYLTLFPETTVTVTHPFALASCWNRRDPTASLTNAPRAPGYRGEVFRKYLEPGHSYLFGFAGGAGISWWKYGTKEEVLAPVGAPPSETARGWPTEPPIIFSHVQDLEIQIVE